MAQSILVLSFDTCSFELLHSVVKASYSSRLVSHDWRLFAHLIQRLCFIAFSDHNLAFRLAYVLRLITEDFMVSHNFKLTREYISSVILVILFCWIDIDHIAL